MSILIKDMEMPQGCFYCICNKHLDPDTDMCILTRDAFDSTFRVVEHRRDNCPLVPVPPHGRCIDADALTQRIVEECDKFDAMNQYDSGLRAGYRASTEAVRLAPTIIPAEEGEA